MAARPAFLARVRSWLQRLSADLAERSRDLRDLTRGAASAARQSVGARLPQSSERNASPALHRVRRAVELWHRGECWLAVAAFGFIAAILLLDVIGREFIGPALRFVGLEPGATGIFAAQKLSVFALVIGSFAGIGIATATGAHIVPRFAFGWIPAAWGPAMDRLADILSALFLVGVAWFGFKFVGSSLKTDLRAPVLDWPVWPIQLFIPLGFLSAAGRYFLYAAWPPLKPALPEFQE
jgi:TRAP-type C4-dicarboxylate transport system permease small subunit